MATTSKWTAPASIALDLTTELNSLANAALCTASAAYDNSSGLYLYATFELVLASLTPTGTPYCNLYLVASADGTNYEDNTVSATHQIVAVFPMSTATAAKRIVVRNILLPPQKLKIILENKTGPSFAASANTVHTWAYYEQQV